MSESEIDAGKLVDQAIATLVDAAEGGNSDQYDGKRDGTRFREPLHLEVTKDPGNESASWYASMHNVGPGGCAFWSRRELAAQEIVCVREATDDPDACWIRGRVVHLTVGIRGHLVGVEFDRAKSKKMANCEPGGGR